MEDDFSNIDTVYTEIETKKTVLFIQHSVEKFEFGHVHFFIPLNF
jgi:hypothetical protein